MKIPESVADEVTKLTMKELYEWFIMLEDEYEEWEKDYTSITRGINLKFPIYYIWEEKNIKNRYKEDEVTIRNHGTIEKETYEREKQLRKKLMKEAILNNVMEIEIDTPR